MRIGLIAACWLCTGAALRFGQNGPGVASHLFSKLPMQWRSALDVDSEVMSMSSASALLKCRIKPVADLHMLWALNARGGRVMIKVADLVDEQARAIFERERYFQRVFQGPSFLETIRSDTARTPQGDVGMIVTESPDSTLKALIEEETMSHVGALTKPTMIRIMVHILRAVVELQREYIVHRDIQPSNIVIVGDLTERGPGAGRRLTAKLTNFGSAGDIFDLGSVTTDLRRSLDRVRRSYIAPEIFTRKDQTPAGWLQADVWSLGLVLLEMFSGSLPFGWEGAANVRQDVPGAAAFAEMAGIDLDKFYFEGSGSESDFAHGSKLQNTVGWARSPRRIHSLLEGHIKEHIEDEDIRNLLKRMLAFRPENRVSAESAMRIAERIAREDRIPVGDPLPRRPISLTRVIMPFREGLLRQLNPMGLGLGTMDGMN